MKMLSKYYRNITFDTLKERHDNFSFQKAIDTKHQIYDTMHFKGLIKDPINPKLMIFRKNAGKNEGEEGITDMRDSLPGSQRRSETFNKGLLYNSENSTRYDKFVQNLGAINKNEMAETQYEAARIDPSAVEGDRVRTQT